MLGLVVVSNAYPLREAIVRPVAQEIMRIFGIAVIAGGLAAALALLFVPLSVGRTSEGSTVLESFCGPGATSDNAIQVRIDPGIVNTGGIPGAPAAPAAEQRQLEQFCTREADTRLTEAGVTAAVALILGIGATTLSRRSGTRTPEFRPPVQPWAPGPPSV
ncbi:MAG: hypothetical protein QOJ73_5184 [Streptosporangiaceae bacterium]|jgi:hypothetical protein|nr:hypothetical protein [Streptosporangiaceae bacterium]